MGNGTDKKLKSILENFGKCLGGMSVIFASSQFSLAAIPSAEIQLEKVGEEITAVENEILRTDAKAANVQIQRLRKLVKLQRKEIQLTEVRIQELTKKVESIGARKLDLESLIRKERELLYRQLKRLTSAVNGESAAGGSSASIDVLWLTAIDTDFEKGRYLENLTKKQLALLKNLLKDRSQVVALESEILEEKNSLEFTAQELKEKESMLVANERLQSDLLRSKKNLDKEHLAKISKLKDLREGERGIRKVISVASIEEKANEAVAEILMHKGKLRPPISGEVVSGFGRHYDVATSLLTFQKGISIMGEASGEVRSVFKGKVVYSGALKNYGQMVILEHPGQYYTLYGQLGETHVKEGSFVEDGEVVGLVAKSGAPLYFEIRDRNVAINPIQWIETKTLSLNK